MSEKTGGPAFPSSIIHEGHSHIVGFLGEQIEPGETSNYAGMTLRDYFAAKASDKDVETAMYQGKIFMSRQEARYAHADLMVAERAK